MTNEEIAETLSEIETELQELDVPDKKLDKMQRRHLTTLKMKKQVLEQVKEARENQNSTKEMKLLTTYGMLTSFGDKHPFFLYFLQTKFRGGFYI